MANAPDGIDARNYTPTATDTFSAVTGVFGTDSRPAQYYADVCAELNSATADLDAISTDLITSVQTELDGATALMNSLGDEVIGGTDLILQSAGTPLFKVQEKLLKDTSTTLQSALTDLARNGFTPAYLTADMQSAMTMDWVQMVAAATPPMQDVLGYTPAEPAYSQPAPFAAPSVAFDVNQPSSYTPTAPTATGQPDASSLNLWTTDAAQQQTTMTALQQSSNPLCCPAPVNVTLNVPPIVPVIQFVPAPPPSGPGGYPTAPPTSPGASGWQPAAPGNLNVQVFAAPGAPGAPPPPAGPSFAGSTPSSLLFPLGSIDVAATNSLAINWGSIDGCDRIKEVMDKAAGIKVALPAPNVTDPLKSYIDSNFGQGIFKMIAAGDPATAEKFRGVAKTFVDVAPLLANAALSTVDNMATSALMATFLPQNVPNPVTGMMFAAKVGAATMAEKKTGVPMTYMAQGDLYGLQYTNPQFLPNQIRTDSAFLNGQIDESTWVCWTRANGNLPEPSRRVMTADQVKPGLMDLITLYRRGNLKKEDLPKRARDVGVLEPAFIPEWLEITKQLPGQADLIRFMVRDAADQTVVDQYGYDVGFTDKYTKQLKKWADALGLDETYFKYMWRSHWQIPSYTQLTEMLTRLRRDRIEVKEWEAKNGPWTPDPPGKPTPGKPRVVTIKDVQNALEVNDMSPGWINELISVSYTPINRTDSVRAYMTGAFGDEQLLDAFQNAKYSPRDAQIMLDFYRKDRARRQRNISGTWAPRKVVRYYKAALVTRDAAEALLRPVMPSATMIADVLDGADAELSADMRATALKGYKRGWMYGQYSAEEMKLALTSLGLAADQADRLITLWSIERGGRQKQPTVAMIGKWVTMSIISMEEGRQRLVNLGYSTLDADRILAAALKWDYDGAPPSNEELSDAIESVVKNQKEARKRSDVGLARRVKQILDELSRVRAEQGRRAENAGEPKPPPITLP